MSFPVPSLNSLESFVFELCCGQTDKQTGKHTDSKILPTPTNRVEQNTCRIDQACVTSLCTSQRVQPQCTGVCHTVYTTMQAMTDMVVWAAFHPQDYTTVVTFGRQHISFWKLFWDQDHAATVSGSTGSSGHHQTGRLLRDKQSGAFEVRCSTSTLILYICAVMNKRIRRELYPRQRASGDFS